MIQCREPLTSEKSCWHRGSSDSIVSVRCAWENGEEQWHYKGFLESCSFWGKMSLFVEGVKRLLRDGFSVGTLCSVAHTFRVRCFLPGHCCLLWSCRIRTQIKPSVWYFYNDRNPFLAQLSCRYVRIPIDPFLDWRVCDSIVRSSCAESQLNLETVGKHGD